MGSPSMLDLPAAYRAEGLRVWEVPGWQARGHSDGPMRPRGGGWHHTSDNIGVKSVFNYTGNPKAPTGPDIRSDVPQPRANIWVPRVAGFDLAMIAGGVAFHFGKGSRTALKLAWDGKVSHATPDAAAANYPDDNDDTAPGNLTMIGHEVENLGDGQALTDQQLAALPRIAAAECRLFGWTPGHHMHHRQYTRRKPDMQWRGDLWSLTAAVLAHAPGEDTMSAQDVKDILDGLRGLFHLPPGGLAVPPGQTDNGNLAKLLLGGQQAEVNRDAAEARTLSALAASVEPEALAAELAPLLQGKVQQLSEGDLAAIATSVADEQARRQAS